MHRCLYFVVYSIDYQLFIRTKYASLVYRIGLGLLPLIFVIPDLLGSWSFTVCPTKRAHRAVPRRDAAKIKIEKLVARQVSRQGLNKAYFDRLTARRFFCSIIRLKSNDFFSTAPYSIGISFYVETPELSMISILISSVHVGTF